MKNPFYNAEETRLRSFFRIVMFIFLFAFATGLPLLIPYDPLAFILQSMLSLGLFYLMYRFVDLRPLQWSGLRVDSIWIKECLAGIGIAALTMALIFLSIWASHGLEITGYGWERSGQTFWLISLFYFFIRMVSVGFYEEVMARGYLIPNIKEGFTFGKVSPEKATIIAIILSSSIFGMLHAGNPNATVMAIINIVLAGIMLAIPFVITGRLALSIGLHFSWNFFQGGIFGFRVSGMEFRSSIFQIQQGGPDWWTGGAFGPEAGVIGILGILLVIVLSMLYLRYTGIELNYSKVFSKSYKELKASQKEE